MKVKVIDEECVRHINDGTCCSYDLVNTVFEAVPNIEYIR